MVGSVDGAVRRSKANALSGPMAVVWLFLLSRLSTDDDVATSAAGSVQIQNWRRGWDSNPRYAEAHDGFQDRSLNPLGHPSAHRSTYAS